MINNNSKLEKRLWDAADQLRANSKLTSTEYSMPVLGLIFLRHAYNRYLMFESEIIQSLPIRNGQKRAITKDDFTKKSALFLNEESKYDYLLNLPGGANIGQAIINAMDLIEADYDSLKGVLPKDYNIFEDDLLVKILKIFNDDALISAPGDVFGRIYEYFLMKFAMAGAQDSGEFFTPVSLVQTIVNVIEPNHGIIFDPACGSGGMFVQSAHFIEKLNKDIKKTVTFYGQEKTKTTIKLAKMNLAVHGLEGKIAEGNTFYEDVHELYNKKDDKEKPSFVMANPPFNVNGVDADKVKNDPRLAFSLPGVNKKDEVSNGNYLWISYFYSYLNNKGRAGFVMSSQASSAGGGEKDVRRKIIETGHVDIMISIRSNFFYTRTVPCELWFFDKGKPDEKLDKILMIDARNIYRRYQDSRRIFEFSPEQLKNITSIVWLYRGEKEKYLTMIMDYLEYLISNMYPVSDKISYYNTSLYALNDKIVLYFENNKKSKNGLSDIFISKFQELMYGINSYMLNVKKMIKLFLDYIRSYQNKIPSENAAQIKMNNDFDVIHDNIKIIIKQIESTYKNLSDMITLVDKEVTEDDKKYWIIKEINNLKKDFEDKKQITINELNDLIYIHRNIKWLQEKFPNAELENVEGLVKLVSRKEVEENDWSLTPGRYVGISKEPEDEDFDFAETMKELHIELETLNKESIILAKKINNNLNNFAFDF